MKVYNFTSRLVDAMSLNYSAFCVNDYTLSHRILPNTCQALMVVSVLAMEHAPGSVRGSRIEPCNSFEAAPLLSHIGDLFVHKESLKAICLSSSKYLLFR